MKRHPKACKYFVTQKSCKFGESCSYKHDVHNNPNEISEQKEKKNWLEGSILILHAKLSELIKEVANIKKDSQLFNCIEAPYLNKAKLG